MTGSWITADLLNMAKRNPSGDDDLQETLLAELTEGKNLLIKIIRQSPENLQAHRMHCTYAGKIIDIHKAMIQSRALDPELLLIEFLKTTVSTLIEKGETAAAENLGSCLDEIGERVRRKWMHPEETGWTVDIMKSATSSGRRSPPSAVVRRNTRKKGSPVPKTN